MQGHNCLLASKWTTLATHQEVVAHAPLPVLLWLSDVGSPCYDPSPTATYVEPPSVLVPQDEHAASIATL
jgi:hypothetical protein